MLHDLVVQLFVVDLVGPHGLVPRARNEQVVVLRVPQRGNDRLVARDHVDEVSGLNVPAVHVVRVLPGREDHLSALVDGQAGELRGNIWLQDPEGLVLRGVVAADSSVQTGRYQRVRPGAEFKASYLG